MDIEHSAQAVAGIGVEVASVSLLGALVEVVVLRNEFLELGLDVHDLLGGKLIFNNGHTGGREVSQEGSLVRLQEKETAPLRVGSTSCPTDTVNIIARVIRRVELDDPID